MSRSSIGRSTRAEVKEWPNVAIIVLALLSAGAMARPSSDTSMVFGSGSARPLRTAHVTPGQYPFLAWINRTCGGSIFGNYYIITSANCFDTAVLEKTAFGEWLKPVDELEVRVGVHDLNNDGEDQLVKIAGVLIHEKYNATTNSHDIAILKTESPIEFNLTDDERGLVRIVYLPHQGDDDIDKWPLTLAGWCAYYDIRSGVEPPKPTPRRMSVITRPIEECREIEPWKGEAADWETKLCAGPTDSTGNELIANTGSPLFRRIFVFEHELIGIALYGPEVTRGITKPRAYTRVAKYTDWIRMNTPEEWPTTS